MDFGTWLQIATLTVVVCTGGVVPFVISAQKNARNERENRFNKIDNSLVHLDQCIDNLRADVGSKLVSREEMVQAKADYQQAMLDMREAIASDTNGLHQRILRLEDFHMGVPGGNTA